jgi:hypothetical protein
MGSKSHLGNYSRATTEPKVDPGLGLPCNTDGVVQQLQAVLPLAFKIADVFEQPIETIFFPPQP